MTELTVELIASMRVLSEPALSPAGTWPPAASVAVREIENFPPDGRFVVYALAPMGNKDEHPLSALWLSPIDGSAASRQFTAGVAEDRQPRWSPDARRVALGDVNCARELHQPPGGPA